MHLTSSTFVWYGLLNKHTKWTAVVQSFTVLHLKHGNSCQRRRLQLGDTGCCHSAQYHGVLLLCHHWHLLCGISRIFPVRQDWTQLDWYLSDFYDWRCRCFFCIIVFSLSILKHFKYWFYFVILLLSLSSCYKQHSFLRSAYSFSSRCVWWTNLPRHMDVEHWLLLVVCCWL